MDILALIRDMAVKVCVALICLLAFSSCNGWLYEEEGDCSMYYKVRFRYDRNLKWADAFSNEVSSVHMYAFDKSGLLVWQNEERIDSSMIDNYSMSLDLPAGDYRLLAWCGLKNGGEEGESFSVPEAYVGETRLEQLQCTLNRRHDESGAYSEKKLYRLFHGSMDVSLPVDDDGGVFYNTMYLTKNTNHVRVILQHLSGKDVDVNRFAFRIEDENGLMAHDNGLLADENIIYRPWKMQNSDAGVDKQGNARAIANVRGAIADITVGRMMETHREKMVLVISDNEDDRTVARIPVIDYALLAKDYYEEEYGHTMTDQEFLDREDDYVMTLFLDEDNQWISSYILIHSWRIVTSDVEIE